MQSSAAHDTTLCVESLRAALAGHGITLPSLGVDLPSLAGSYRPPVGLVSLGNCNLQTARRLTEVLREAACLRIDLLATSEAVPRVRRAVGAYVDAEVRDEVRLCVTELVANVVRLVGEGTPVRVRVFRGVAGVPTRVEVADPAKGALPVLHRARAEDEFGRGLSLVDAVACGWGVERGAAGGKTVWCEVGGTGPAD
ncbi:ATP-binding protein [Streptomyces sp. VN1]|nr:ATP-binding protein [Streptomyces sp. VN1]